MKKAVLVIDVQEVFVGKDHAKMFDYGDRLVENINGIIRKNDGCTVVYIRNFMKRNFINKFAPYHVYENSPESEPAKDLEIVSEHEFVKYKGDAFSNPELDAFLKSVGTDTVELVGLDGAACVPMTALGAVKKGYKVIINEKGVGTFKLYRKRKEKYDRKLKQLGVEFI